MKYIKEFEGRIIKKTDSRIIDHPLLPLADVAEKMLNTLAELQNISQEYPIGKVKRYFVEGFHDPISIKLSYNSFNENNFMIGHLFGITLSSNNNTYSISMNVSNSDTNREKRLEVEKRLYEFMRKYVSRSNYLYAGGKNEFTDNDMNDIINEIKKITLELQIEIETNKYNI